MAVRQMIPRYKAATVIVASYQPISQGALTQSDRAIAEYSHLIGAYPLLQGVSFGMKNVVVPPSVGCIKGALHCVLGPNCYPPYHIVSCTSNTSIGGSLVVKPKVHFHIRSPFVCDSRCPPLTQYTSRTYLKMHLSFTTKLAPIDVLLLHKTMGNYRLKTNLASHASIQWASSHT